MGVWYQGELVCLMSIFRLKSPPSSQAAAVVWYVYGFPYRRLLQKEAFGAWQQPPRSVCSLFYFIPPPPRIILHPTALRYAALNYQAARAITRQGKATLRGRGKKKKKKKKTIRHLVIDT